jgi:hypothetical protein
MRLQIILVSLFCVTSVSHALDAKLPPNRESKIREAVISAKCLNEISLAQARAVDTPAVANKISGLYDSFNAYTDAAIEFAAAKTSDDKSVYGQATTNAWHDAVFTWNEIKLSIADENLRQSITNDCYEGVN